VSTWSRRCAARRRPDNGFDVIINAEDDELAAAEASLAGGEATVRAVRADLSTYDGVERLWAGRGRGGQAAGRGRSATPVSGQRRLHPATSPPPTTCG
jgi:hypothetical protein